MDAPVIPFDLQRMLWGDESPLFALEIIVRTLIIYGYTLVLLRWLGSRTVGQLSTVEFLLVIALGSAVGDAMFYPDVPLLHAMIVVTVVVVANRILDELIRKSPRAERLIDGEPYEVIRDGVLSTRFLKHGPISREELFQRLRENGIEQLGEVKRAYIEKDGHLTTFRFSDEARPGLRIVPPNSIEQPQVVGPDGSDGAGLVCVQCGHLNSGGERSCSQCGYNDWTKAEAADL